MTARLQNLRQRFRGPNRLMAMALASAMMVLVSAAVIGARDAEQSFERTTAQREEAREELAREYADRQEATAGPATEAPKPQATQGASAPAPGTPQRPAAPQGSVALPSQPGATREGVFSDHFEFGVHAPITLNGAPLNVAEDPITGFKGYITHLNRSGGVNGRKVRLFLEDDKYTTNGGKEAADKLVRGVKPFFISGTLGIDQVAIVAAEAGRAGIPYMAIGGPEPEFKDVGMFQVGANYDQVAQLLAKFICKHGREYVGGEVRLGTTTLDTPLILPVERRFVAALEEGKCVKTPVDPDARGKILKPDQQTTYQSQLIRLRQSYDGQGANLIVPFQDPVSTSRQVAELKGYKSTYNPKWTFANFAHDSDTVLSLMGGEWNGVRGLSGACNYTAETRDDVSKCAQMGQAHREWAALGQVRYDQNAGGCAGGKCEYNYTEQSWQADGQGGAAGYQLVHFWLGAMKAVGNDPTRERFVAALMAYNGYSDLITAPITFANTGNRMIGANGAVVLEGQSNMKYRQVTELTPGIVDQF